MHSQIPQIIKGFGFDGAIMRTHFMMSVTILPLMSLLDGGSGLMVQKLQLYLRMLVKVPRLLKQLLIIGSLHDIPGMTLRSQWKVTEKSSNTLILCWLQGLMTRG